MERPPREALHMATAAIHAARSTCDRLHVGAVAVRDGRILVTGYNGAPAGLPHCVHLYAEDPCTSAVHAEANIVAYAARHGVALEGCEVYVTHSPCLKCAHLLINAGVDSVTYATEYRLIDGVAELIAAGVTVKHWLKEH